jgi:hypothetical protein
VGRVAAAPSVSIKTPPAILRGLAIAGGEPPVVKVA